MDMTRIAKIPATPIHGRLDVPGPLDTAWDLHHRWPASELIVIEDAGHGGDSMIPVILTAIAKLEDPSAAPGSPIAP